jgi:hypothetical protein
MEEPAPKRAKTTDVGACPGEGCPHKTYTHSPAGDSLWTSGIFRVKSAQERLKAFCFLCHEEVSFHGNVRDLKIHLVQLHMDQLLVHFPPLEPASSRGIQNYFQKGPPASNSNMAMSQVSRQAASRFLIRWVAACGISFNSLQHPFFKKGFISCIAPDFSVPSEKEMRQLLLQVVALYHDSVRCFSFLRSCL